jgi:hypothetical protein
MMRQTLTPAYKTRPDLPGGFTPGQLVTWVSSPGGRRNLRRNCFAGYSRSVPAVVVGVGPKLVTIEAEGERHVVKTRNLTAAQNGGGDGVQNL